MKLSWCFIQNGYHLIVYKSYKLTEKLVRNEAKNQTYKISILDCIVNVKRMEMNIFGGYKKFIWYIDETLGIDWW